MIYIRIILLTVAIVLNYSCGGNDDKFDDISEFILVADVTNKQTSNIVVDNTAKKITFDLAQTEKRTDVNIKLTLADGVSMISPVTPQADYNLTTAAKIILSAGKRTIVFDIIAGNYASISEFILAAEVTNRQVRNMVINNVAKEITFDLSKTATKTDVNIKLTLAGGVSMVSPATPQADYDLTVPAQIELLADESVQTFTVKAGEYMSTSDLLAEKGWTQQTSFGTLKNGVLVYKSPPAFKGKNIVGYIALGDVDIGIGFHVLGDVNNNGHVAGTKTPTQFYNNSDGEYPIVINGTFWWWDSNTGTNRNTGLIHRNGVMIEPTPRTVTRSGLTYHVTRGVFSYSNNNEYRTDWAYTTNVSQAITYAYPSPLVNPIPPGTPQPTPTANFPAGGWRFYAHTAIGGGPLLIKNGIIYNNWQSELYDEASTIGSTSNNPRTAIGFTGDRQILIFVCEGRYMTPSTPGLTLQEVAELLLEIDCVELLNLDGGGSSCMLVNGIETIKPSDGTQRSVVTAIGLK